MKKNPCRADVTAPLARASFTSSTPAQPILALDMYEHSDHMDCGALATVYVDAFAINSTNVARALTTARA